MNSYDIIDPEVYQKYGPQAIPLIMKYGGQVLAADYNAIPIEGTIKTMNAIIRFPSERAALDCYNDPLYQEVKKIRTASTANCTITLVKTSSWKAAIVSKFEHYASRHSYVVSIRFLSCH